MRVLGNVQRAGSVKRALQKAASELNRELAKTPGYITRMDASVDAGVTGSTVRIVVTIDESDIRPKCILWVNEAGKDERSAFSRAERRINAQLTKLKGQVAGFYMKFIRPPLPKRIYATLIMAVNEEVPSKISKLDVEERRERLAAVMRLLGNDPKAVNLSRIAKMFGVSRDVIYKDLRKLGIQR